MKLAAVSVAGERQVSCEKGIRERPVRIEIAGIRIFHGGVAEPIR